ncbi:Long-chain-fatty-acid--CoA ligase FadD13 [Variovorax sp. PBS-H4]|uniref:class I adenylate-forming enzyme family protein n=1 Tax=Variovorax sp. PBS-H4 TaxID=434008 RepID=UPI00131826D7|nr:class I adenylate-forming enzyme family protein [Variovorax sp. PBS-H4]VTU36056.1 Long-chain-fatty-acid--CoA ligase FadD13 [Variovorax sp. PBS-H4]
MKFASYLAAGARRYGSKPALICGNTTLTFSQLDEASTRVAAALQANGVEPGDRIGIFLPNCIEFIVCFLGIVKAGGTGVPINLKLATPEVRFIVEDAAPKFIFVTQARVAELEAATAGLEAPENIVVGEARVGDFLTYAEIQANAYPPLRETPVQTDACIISYTSGTTGRPKGALLTQSNFIVMNGFLNALYWGIQHEDRILLTTPLAHRTAFARLGNLVVFGATLVIMPKFDAEEVATAVMEHRITILGMVPTVGRLLIPTIMKHPARFESLRRILATGEAFPIDLKKELMEWLPKAEIYSFYSMTEVGAVSLLLPPEQVSHAASAGRVLPGLEVKLVDNDAVEVQQGEVGEVWVRSGEPGRFLTMLGYLNRPEANAESFDNGWFKTGDMARFDQDDYIYIVDRKKDMVVSGGYNIYTKEVEMALESHPEVQQAAVIGVPDAVFGEAVAAFVVLKKLETIDTDVLVEWVATQIASYKKPKYVRLIATLPQNAGGKVHKQKLSEIFVK